jgi:hypothetical protein
MTTTKNAAALEFNLTEVGVPTGIDTEEIRIFQM